MRKFKIPVSILMSAGLIFLSACTATNLPSNDKDIVNSQASIDDIKDSGSTTDTDTNTTDTDTDGNDVQNGGEENNGSDVSNTDAEENEYILPAMDTKYHAMYDGYIYFREYRREDIVDPSMLYFGNTFNLQDNHKNHTIHRMDSKGNVEVYTDTDPGMGDICIAGGKLFSQKTISDDYKEVQRMDYYYDLESGETTELNGYSYLLGSYGKYVFLSGYEWNDNGYYEYFPCVLNAETMEDITGAYLAGQDLLGADEDGVYTYSTLADFINEEFGVDIYMTDYSGKTKKIAELDNSQFTDWFFDWGGPEITCYQFLDDEVICNIGYYAGTGHFYQEGMILDIPKDGSGFKIVCDSGYANFYCTEKDGSININNYDLDDTFDLVTSVTNLKGTEEKLGTYIGQKCGEPYVTYGETKIEGGSDLPESLMSGDVTVFPDSTGEMYVLLYAKDYEPFGFKYGQQTDDYDTSDMTEVYNIEYVGDFLFFTITDFERDSENDIGWRYAYTHKKTVDFVKDLKTGDVKKLFEY